MKKQLLKTLIITCALALLPSCQIQSSSSSTGNSESSSSSSSASSSSVATVDYVHDGTVSLSLDYVGHDFYTDGVGQVTLKTSIDGDTAHFYPTVKTTSSEPIKSRYYGIDTPESTGTVEPWGHAASVFNTEKLNEASENGTIVVSAPISSYQAPSFDATGTRYVSLIWVNLTTKNAPKEDLVCLNLWIVQEGYSYLKGVDDMPTYKDTFTKAADQARALGLHVYSSSDDPDFNYGGYQTTSILDIKKEVEKSLLDTTHKNAYDNVKVRIQGTVAGFSNQILYLESYFSEENGGRYTGGEYAGINIFTGMSTIPAKFTQKNAYIELCGLGVDSDNFGFQITSAVFPLYATEDTDATVLFPAADNLDYKLHTFEMKPGSISTSDFSFLNCSVKLTENVVVSGGYDSDDKSDHTLYLKDTSGKSLPFNCYVPFSYKPDPVNQPNYKYSSYTNFVGKQYTITGVYTGRISGSKVYYQINPSGYEDMVEVQA
jgi:endonuclease YncB( thermonuclease family)